MLGHNERLLYVLELAVNTVGFLISILFLAVLWRTKLFLQNHKFYLTNVIVANMITVLCRYPLLIQLLSERKIFTVEVDHRLGQIHDLADSVVVNMITQLIIFFAVMRNVMGKDQAGFITVLALCITPWILGEATIEFGALNIPPPLYSQGIMELINFICWLAFAGLIYMGRVKYRQQVVGDINNKYLMSVCLRTLEVLKAMAICSAIRNFICINVIISLFVYFRPNHDAEGERFVSFFYDQTLAFYAAIVPFLMIFSHEEMHKTYSKFCTMKLMESPISTLSLENETKFVARNIVGDVINPNEQDKAVYHFKQLQNNWGSRKLSIQHLVKKSLTKQGFVKVSSVR